jgi:hypothetical protein
MLTDKVAVLGQAGAQAQDFMADPMTKLNDYATAQAKDYYAQAIGRTPQRPPDPPPTPMPTMQPVAMPGAVPQRPRQRLGEQPAMPAYLGRPVIPGLLDR